MLASLRQSALDWLRADLASHRAQVAGSDACAAGEALAALASWRCDPLWASFRRGAEFEQLPAAERDAWNTLWRDVDAVFARE